mmetsp:Transcript_22824/g.74510  ORF Transcript_22824/g.74510 Transcript_22824/m.74510 type:complete len:210 (-) Transcript_22824:648-1277(-)
MQNINISINLHSSPLTYNCMRYPCTGTHSIGPPDSPRTRCCLPPDPQGRSCCGQAFSLQTRHSDPWSCCAGRSATCNVPSRRSSASIRHFRIHIPGCRRHSHRRPEFQSCRALEHHPQPPPLKSRLFSLTEHCRSCMCVCASMSTPKFSHQAIVLWLSSRRHLLLMMIPIFACPLGSGEPPPTRQLSISTLAAEVPWIATPWILCRQTL